MHSDTDIAPQDRHNPPAYGHENCNPLLKCHSPHPLRILVLLQNRISRRLASIAQYDMLTIHTVMVRVCTLEKA